MDPRPAAHRASQVVLPSLTCSLGTCSECRLPGPVKPTHPPESHCLIGGVVPVSLATQGPRASRGVAASHSCTAPFREPVR